MAQKDVVIVTGSSGFIGNAVVQALAKSYTVVGFDREMPPHPPAQAECVCVDLTSDASVAAAFARVKLAYSKKIASIVHLAAYFDLSGEPDPKYDTVTVEGTERLIGALKGFDVEQFIFVSTMLVHRPGKPGQPINEDWPLDPKLPYRASKIRTEAAIAEHRGSIPAVMLRPAGVYDDLCHSAFLSRQIARIYERQMVGHVYPGDLDTGQPYLHLDDLTRAIIAAIEHRGALPTEIPILLGEPKTLTFADLQEEIGRLMHGEAWATLSLPKPLVQTGVWIEQNVLVEDDFIRPWMVDTSDDHFELDISRAKDLLGWRPRQRVDKTLPKMVAALKNDPAGWYKANGLNAARITEQAIAAKPEEPSAEPAAQHEMMHAHQADMAKMHFNMLWVHFFNMLLGLWLSTSPFVFGGFDHSEFSEAVLNVTRDRGLWDPVLRNAMLAWSDIASGGLIMLFAGLSLSRRFRWAPWATTAVGIWVLFAPLLFWAPSAASYANDTLIGALSITFAILVPMMPGMSMASMMDDTDMPAGWTYSPSTYLQRLPIIALGAVGFVLSRVLAGYQMGHIDGVWEPFFGGLNGLNGTEHIITSNVSKAWPVADGGLGATTYMFEVLMGVMGGRARWRTMPWMVLMFGVVVVPLGVISIYFIIIQPIIIGTYCTICLLAAAAMLIMIPYALDELVAMGQFLLQSHRRGEPFLRTFWQGGADPNGGRERQTSFEDGFGPASISAARGVNLSWTLVMTAALGIWLMFSPLVFGTRGLMANSDHLMGALILTIAICSMAEVARALRFINLGFAMWLALAPWILSGESMVAAVFGVIAGIVLAALTLPRGPRSAQHYGSWDRFVV